MNAENAALVDNLILQSPPTQENEVLGALQDILDPPASQSEFEEKVANLRLHQFYPVKINDSMAILCQDAKIKDGPDPTFIDPKQNISFQFDHKGLTAHSTETLSDNHDDEQQRTMQKKLNEYITDHYSKGGIGLVYRLDSDKYSVVIVSRNTKAESHWAGSWQSRWEVSASAVTGTCSLHVHYYEGGNVQLKYSDKFEKPTQIGRAIETIRSLESEFQKTVVNLYNDVNENGFKYMRRSLPLTKKKMDWTKVVAHAMAEEMAKNMVAHVVNEGKKAD